MFAIAEGMERADAARLAGMERQALHDAVVRFNSEGIAGLYDRPRSGMPPWLNAAQQAELKAWILGGSRSGEATECRAFAWSTSAVTSLFGAVRAGSDDGFALVLPEAKTETMNLFLAEKCAVVKTRFALCGTLAMLRDRSGANAQSETPMGRSCP
jgi:hypothetical protein